jgi:hypothetical protein
LFILGELSLHFKTLGIVFCQKLQRTVSIVSFVVVLLK